MRRNLDYPHKELKIIEKGYHIRLSIIKEGYLLDNIFCYAIDHNCAKSNLLKQINKLGEWDLLYSDDKISYMNIPIERCYEVDKVLFENKVVLRSKVYTLMERNKKKQEIEAMLQNDEITHCYIRKGGYYYRDNARGYTELQYEAGIYPKAEAARHISDEVRIIPINIYEHDKMINDKIEELSKRRILSTIPINKYPYREKETTYDDFKKLVYEQHQKNSKNTPRT